jgi:tyrosyl-tRNA synthetase
MTTHASVAEQRNILSRGCERVYSPEELAERLASGRPLRVKLGMDPTAPDLTLGHTVVLRKLRQFQDHGHQAVLIIGDYTAMIGDPTGRSKTRPMLTAEQIETNARTYLDQAGKVLDLSADRLEVRRNSEWLARMNCADVIKLMAQMTVARLMERDTFAKRQAEGREIFCHELLYPLMQARDSVEIASDVELGGTDQTFNNLCGRDLQRAAGQPPQIVMVMPLLVGIDGANKMSKSMGNYVGVTDPPSEMFGKIMRIPDHLLTNYFELLTDTPKEQVEELVDPARHNPRDTKEHLARLIIAQYHSSEAAEAAAAEFRRVFSGGGSGLPDDVVEIHVPPALLESDPVDAEGKGGTAGKGRIAPVDLVTHCKLASSRAEARRLIAQKGFRLNGEIIEDPFAPIAIADGAVLQRGRRQFVRIRIA